MKQSVVIRHGGHTSVDIAVRDNCDGSNRSHTREFGAHYGNTTDVSGETFFTGPKEFTVAEIEFFEILLEVDGADLEAKLRELEEEPSPLHSPISPSSSDVDVVDELMAAFALLEASRDRTLLNEIDGSTRGKSFPRTWRKFSTRNLRIWSELLRDDGNRFRDSGFPDTFERREKVSQS
jgi:hypothetical protein